MAKKKKQKKSSKHSIAKKIIRALSQAQNKKIVNFEDIKNAKINAEILQNSILTSKDMENHDPLYAIYVYGQNNISLLIEQIAQLPAASKLVTACVDAEEEYMPSWPPASPLSSSYFTCWCSFDLAVGIPKESFGKIAIKVCQHLQVDESLTQIYQILQKSRNGIYTHCGVEGKFVILKEFITNKTIRAITPNGYVGHTGEIWLARVLDEPYPYFHFDYSVVFTSPYVLGRTENGYWHNIGDQLSILSFLKRNITQINISNELDAYKHFMKYGLNRNYWNEYIFLGYANHNQKAIFLTGIPDMPTSLPHSPHYLEGI